MVGYVGLKLRRVQTPKALGTDIFTQEQSDINIKKSEDAWIGHTNIYREKTVLSLCSRENCFSSATCCRGRRSQAINPDFSPGVEHCSMPAGFCE